MTKTACGSDCLTDHRLVVSKLNIRIQPARELQCKKAPNRTDVSKLNQYSMRQASINGICNHLGAMNLGSEDPEENMTGFFFEMWFILQLQLPKAIHVAKSRTGLTRMRFLKEKHRLHKAHQDDISSVFKKVAYSNICKKVQNRLRIKQNSWLSKKAEEIQLMIFICFRFPGVLYGSPETPTVTQHVVSVVSSSLLLHSIIP